MHTARSRLALAIPQRPASDLHFANEIPIGLDADVLAVEIVKLRHGPRDTPLASQSHLGIRLSGIQKIWNDLGRNIAYLYYHENPDVPACPAHPRHPITTPGSFWAQEAGHVIEELPRHALLTVHETAPLQAFPLAQDESTNPISEVGKWLRRRREWDRAAVVSVSKW